MMPIPNVPRMRPAALALPLLLWAALAGAPANAQSLQDQIVGTWTLSSVYDQHEDGSKTNPWGDGVEGQLTYTANGRFSLMIISANRAPSNGPPPTPVGPALGYFGTYTVDSGAVVHLPERSTFPNWEGKDRPLTTTVTGDQMAQTAPAIGPPGQSYVPHLNWTRSR